MADSDDQQPEATGPETITASRLPDQACLECKADALAVVAVTGSLGGQERVLGGWAWCQRCNATPHPTLTEEARRG